MQADNPEQLELQLHLATMLEMISNGYYSQKCRQWGYYGIVINQENVGKSLQKDLPSHTGVEISRNSSYIDGYSVGIIIPKDGVQRIHFLTDLNHVPRAQIYKLLTSSNVGSVRLTTE